MFVNMMNSDINAIVPAKIIMMISIVFISLLV